MHGVFSGAFPDSDLGLRYVHYGYTSEPNPFYTDATCFRLQFSKNPSVEGGFIYAGTFWNKTSSSNGVKNLYFIPNGTRGDYSVSDEKGILIPEEDFQVIYKEKDNVVLFSCKPVENTQPLKCTYSWSLYSASSVLPDEDWSVIKQYLIKNSLEVDGATRIDQTQCS
jgi:hypothetical protein